MKNLILDEKIKMILNKLDDSDINSNFDSCIDLVNEYSQDPRLKFNTIALKSALKLNPDEETLELLKNKMKELLKDLNDDNTSTGTKINELQTDEVKKRFLNLTPKYPLVMECKDIIKSYSNTDFKLGEINCDFREGEITGVVGENAHGKSTLLKIIAGSIKQDGGKLTYSFYDEPGVKDNWDRIKNNIAYLPQELPTLYGTLRQMISLSASIHGIKGIENDYETNYIINRLGLLENQDTPYRKLSGGYKLRFMIAKLLVWKPKLLILDEPLGNLDINAQNSLLTDLRYLSQSISNPISIILSSQHLEEVESVADNMLVLQNGRMSYFGKASNVGSELPNNVFEIKCNLNITELSQLFSELNYDKIEKSGFNYVITTSKSISRKEILNYLLTKDIEYNYFNDISNSVKRIILKSNS